MIHSLCSSVERHTSLPALTRKYSGGGYRMPVTITEAFPFLTKLSDSDRNAFLKRATFSIENSDIDQRSAVVRLENPIEVQGVRVLALRLKGVFPRIDGDRSVRPYESGAGYCDRVFSPVSGNIIKVRKQRMAVETGALGTMGYNRLRNEIEAALLLGPKTTDLLLGFGIFNDLLFEGKPVGFVVYGMETESDRRILSDLKAVSMKSGQLPEGAYEQAKHVGKLLRRKHDNGIAHGYPHLENFRKMLGVDVRILDLDTSVYLLTVPSDTRAAFRYLDLSRTINDYMRSVVHKEVYDGEAEIFEIPFTPLLPHFLWGYFGGNTELSFVSELLPFLNNPPTRTDYRKLFGTLPDFGEGWRQGVDDTLIAPISTLHTLNEGQVLDLNDFRSRPFFDGFLGAIESVAA